MACSRSPCGCDQIVLNFSDLYEQTKTKWAIAWKFLRHLSATCSCALSYMPQPRVFHGQREKWLDAQSEDYGKAIDLNTTVAFIRGVQCHYLVCWPMSLPHNEEQSVKFLAQVDDNAPIEEEDLSAYSVKQHEEMSVVLKLRKAVSQHLLPVLAKL